MMKSQMLYCSLSLLHAGLKKPGQTPLNQLPTCDICRGVTSGSAQACVSTITAIPNLVSLVAGQFIPAYQGCGQEIGRHSTKEIWSLLTPPVNAPVPSSRSYHQHSRLIIVSLSSFSRHAQLNILHKSPSNRPAPFKFSTKNMHYETKTH